jgi:nicotinate-nucleotide pyrophosphorylase (carboxylating)
MIVPELTYNQIVDVVARALAEDVGQGDVTTMSVISANPQTRGRVVFREDAIVAGLSVAHEVFRQLDASAEIDARSPDGSRVGVGETVGIVVASTRAMLGGERVALNFLQRLSGIASLTREFVEAVDGTRARILDTRKTTPLLRVLEKHAVRMGGGFNHRAGLFDAILIKDNHVALVGGLPEAIRRVREANVAGTRIHAEVESPEEVPEAIEAGATALLLDNMTPQDVARSVELAEGRVPLEATGGITLANVREYAEAGVDDISIGALTHSARAIDIGLDL